MLALAIACGPSVGVGDPSAGADTSTIGSDDSTAGSTAGATESTGDPGDVNGGDVAVTGDPGSLPWEDWIEAACNAIVACDCPASSGFADLDACTTSLDGDLQAFYPLWFMDEVAWDAECAQARLDRIALECSGGSDAEAECIGTYCPLFVGTLGRGACAPYEDDRGSPCAAGLVCDDGRCVDYCHVFDDDELCESLFGESGPGASCPAGEVCIVSDGGSGSCAAAPGAGQPCTLQFEPPCAEGLWCIDGICDAPTAGRPCADALYCDSATAYCVDGQCAALGQPGDPCTRSIECAGACVDQVCATLPDIDGADCATTGACGGGLVCDRLTQVCAPPTPTVCAGP